MAGAHVPGAPLPPGSLCNLERDCAHIAPEAVLSVFVFAQIAMAVPTRGLLCEMVLLLIIKRFGWIAVQTCVTCERGCVEGWWVEGLETVPAGLAVGWACAGGDFAWRGGGLVVSSGWVADSVVRTLAEQAMSSKGKLCLAPAELLVLSNPAHKSHPLDYGDAQVSRIGTWLRHSREVGGHVRAGPEVPLPSA